MIKWQKSKDYAPIIKYKIISAHKAVQYMIKNLNELHVNEITHGKSFIKKFAAPHVIIAYRGQTLIYCVNIFIFSVYSTCQYKICY